MKIFIIINIFKGFFYYCIILSFYHYHHHHLYLYPYVLDYMLFYFISLLFIFFLILLFSKFPISLSSSSLLISIVKNLPMLHPKTINFDRQYTVPGSQMLQVTYVYTIYYTEIVYLFPVYTTSILFDNKGTERHHCVILHLFDISCTEYRWIVAG